MSSARWLGVLASAALVALPMAPGAPPTAVLAATPSSAAAEEDEPRSVLDRSHELLRLDCFTDHGRRDVTLFGNGTARLRAEGSAGDGMALAELSQREVADYIDLLAAVKLDEVPRQLDGPEGATVERCMLTLQLPGRDRQEFHFRRFDSLPLGLARLLTITATIEERIGPPGSGSHLPPDYEPRPGDVLRRSDGALFRVIDLTVDGEGVELQGIDQPLVIYVSVAGLDEEMIELVERADARLEAP